MNPPTPASPITLSVFVSSPGDLKEMREVARTVILEMSGIEVGGQVVTLVPMLWEDHTPAWVGWNPQKAVDYFMGQAEHMDLYVGMFWTTLGSEVEIDHRRYPSGTLYEFESAYEGFRESGRPWLVVFRCRQDPPAGADLEKLAAVNQFFDRFRGERPQYEGFPRPFASGEEFAGLLRKNLEKLLEQRFAPAKPESPARAGDLVSREAAVLVDSVRKFLATFDDLFGKAPANAKERERKRAFQLRYRALPDPNEPDDLATEELLPGPGESLWAVYQRWGHRMMFIGDRGTGKTFTMLQLMQELAERAARDRAEPVPVYFNLSSWNATHEVERSEQSSWRRWLARWLAPDPGPVGETLDRWLEDQLVRSYSVQRKVARRLIETHRLVFCLDGLDELAVAHGPGDQEGEAAARGLREACVRAINATLKSDAVRLVLCCREETYRELGIKPRLGHPLKPQLLSSEEVVEYLRDWPLLDGLRSALERSPLLQEKARVALFLGMMRIAYQDLDAERILRATRLDETGWHKHLLDHYVQQCMKLAPPECEQTTKDLIPRCLEWMAAQPDNDFLLDDLQPSVLCAEGATEGAAAYRRYRLLSVAVLAASLTLMEATATGLGLGINWGSQYGWGTGLGHGAGMFALSVATALPFTLLAFSARAWARLGVSAGLCWALIHSEVELVFTRVSADPGAGTWIGALITLAIAVPSATTFFCLLGEQFFARLNAVKRRYVGQPGIEWYEIQPIEPKNWFWVDPSSPWRGGWVGLVVGPAIGLATWWNTNSTRGVGIGLLLTWLITICCGLSGSGIARVSIEPNQGMARSLRHALLMMVMCSLGGVICLGIVHGTAGGVAFGLAMAALGLSLGFTFYVFGGIPVIRQACLGHLLHLQGRLPTWFCWPPWRATVQFLDELVRYKLLRRSAGGYMFRHETLRQYYRNQAKNKD